LRIPYSTGQPTRNELLLNSALSALPEEIAVVGHGHGGHLLVNPQVY
jgi:hypothetical protein